MARLKILVTIRPAVIADYYFSPLIKPEYWNLTEFTKARVRFVNNIFQKINYVSRLDSKVANCKNLGKNIKSK